MVFRVLRQLIATREQPTNANRTCIAAHKLLEVVFLTPDVDLRLFSQGYPSHARSSPLETILLLSRFIVSQLQACAGMSHLVLTECNRIHVDEGSVKSSACFSTLPHLGLPQLRVEVEVLKSVDGVLKSVDSIKIRGQVLKSVDSCEFEVEVLKSVDGRYWQ